MKIFVLLTKYKATVLMQRLSYVTKTILSNNNIRSRKFVSF